MLFKKYQADSFEKLKVPQFRKLYKERPHLGGAYVLVFWYLIPVEPISRCRKVWILRIL